MLNKKTIRDWDLSGKRVLLRADYNVPVRDGEIHDDYRLTQSLPTIKYILEQPGASLVIISHLGRPDGRPNPEYSLLPVAKRISSLLGREVQFAADCIGEPAKKICDSLAAGQVALLENVRFHAEEEKNDEQFARAIIEATGAELFVQDGFGVVHRAHASTDAIARQSIPAVAGLLLEREVNAIVGAMENPQRPLLALVGGAKISDKIEVLNRLIDIADVVAVAGAMANNFLAAEGVKIGQSLVEPEVLDTAREILHRARQAEKERGFNFLIPVDAVVSVSKDGKAPTRLVDISSHSIADIQAYPRLPEPLSYSVNDNELILDIGPVSAALVAGAIRASQTVIWNGTCGVTEVVGLAGAAKPFAHGTKIVVDAMTGSSNQHRNKPFTVVGGGDTAAYVEEEGLVEDFNHVSTGGGASMELMSGKELPGVLVLWDKDG